MKGYWEKMWKDNYVIENSLSFSFLKSLSRSNNLALNSFSDAFALSALSYSYPIIF